MTKPSKKDEPKRIEEVPTHDLVDSIRAELEYERQRKQAEEEKLKKKR
jgi:hypothetical protein